MIDHKSGISIMIVPVFGCLISLSVLITAGLMFGFLEFLWRNHGNIFLSLSIGIGNESACIPVSHPIPISLVWISLILLQLYCPHVPAVFSSFPCNPPVTWSNPAPLSLSFRITLISLKSP